MRLSIALLNALGAILSAEAAAIPKGCKNPGVAYPVKPASNEVPSWVPTPYPASNPSSSLGPSVSLKPYPNFEESSSIEPSASSKPYSTYESASSPEPSVTSKSYPTLGPYPTFEPSKAQNSSRISTPCKSSTVSLSSKTSSDVTSGTEPVPATSSEVSSTPTESATVTFETSIATQVTATSSATLDSSISSHTTESTSTVSEASSSVVESSSSISELSSSASETGTPSTSSSLLSTSTESSTNALESSTSASIIETSSAISSRIPSTSSISSSTSVGCSATARPTPLPTQVVVDSSFEEDSCAWSWDGTAILASGTGPSEVNPRTGVRSFQGRGSVPQNPWTLNLRQTLFVEPGQTYSFNTWARQALPNVCVVTVAFDGADILVFTPATNAYSSFPASVEVPQSSSGAGTLLVRANCARGGATNRLWIDDITLTRELPKQVIVDPSFEDGSSAWTFDGTGFLSSATGPSTVNPRTGVRSFQARGSAPQTPWTLNLRQTVSVAPGNTYTLEVFARQALPNVCVVSATFNGESILNFTPGTAGYASFAGPVEVTESSGDLILIANCVRGGATNRLWFDDITLTLVE